MQEMSAYDAKAWSEIVRRRERMLHQRRLVPQWMRHRVQIGVDRGSDAWRSVPGAKHVEDACNFALQSLMNLAGRAGSASIRPNAVVRTYVKAGFEASVLSDIRALELRDMDKTIPNLGLAYSAAAGIEGGAAGFFVGGGVIVATGGSIFSAGAAAAPGISVIIGATATDAVAVIIAANRAVAEVAAYYGYDVRIPEERLFALAVLNIGVAGPSGKAAAFRELHRLVQALARKAAWEQLRRNTVAKIVEKTFLKLGENLTKRKLGQAVPVVGIVLGAGMNAGLLLRTVDAAVMIYRERHLRERYDLPLWDDTDVDAGDEAETVDIVGLLDGVPDQDEEVDDEGSAAA